MITIKKGSLKVEADNDSFMVLQDSYDGMYIKFKDGTELRLAVPVSPQVKAIPQIIQKCKPGSNILLDFDSKNIISISN